MHKQQIEYCQNVKSRFPEYFKGVYVLDVGSLDINGSNKYLFDDSEYAGLDMVQGKNVQIISQVHEYKPGPIFGVVICTEMLEHDKHWKESIRSMYNLLCPKGLLLITCATTGREEHGTVKSKPEDSPATTEYYKNITEEMFEEAIVDCSFLEKELISNKKIGDLYFYGIKNDSINNTNGRTSKAT